MLKPKYLMPLFLAILFAPACGQSNGSSGVASGAVVGVTASTDFSSECMGYGGAMITINASTVCEITRGQASLKEVGYYTNPTQWNSSAYAYLGDTITIQVSGSLSSGYVGNSSFALSNGVKFSSPAQGQIGFIASSGSVNFNVNILVQSCFDQNNTTYLCP